MNALIQAECEGDDQPLCCHHQSRRLPKKSTGIINNNNFFSALPVDPSDADDGDFTGDHSDSSSESESLGSNSDLAAMLPTKTVPQRGGNDTCQLRQKTKHKANQPLPATGDSQASKCARVEEVDDEDSGSSQPSTSSALPQLLKVSSFLRLKDNPIYYFYELVEMNSNGQAGDVGDKHYKCYLGNHKVLTIMRAMKSSLNGLIGHLKTHFPPIYQLYLLLKSCGTPPTDDELRIAQGEKVLDPATAAQYLFQLEQASVNIVNAFNNQVTKAFGNWNQARFEELLAQWLVVCDQPFKEVE
ncbi:hypothetical protein BDR03DRAFT_872184 [Suillus americanus]|nr:hypothetical protein BDR03DRAFT_872184 [Suillus americanus]